MYLTLPILLYVLSFLSCLGIFLLGVLLWQRHRFSELERWRARYGSCLRNAVTETLVSPAAAVPLPAAPSWMRDQLLRQYLREMASYVDPQILPELQPRLQEWGISAYCRRRLRYATHRTQRLRVLTLALLLDPATLPTKPRLFHRLLRWGRDPNTQVGTMALRLLLRMAPVQWPKVVEALLESSGFWNPTDLRQLFLDLPADAQDRLWGRLAQAKTRRQLDLLGVFLDYDPSRAYPLLRDPQTEPEVLAQVLRRVTTPSLRPDVRALLQHPQDFVRLQAAVALGRIGTESDIDALILLLRDPGFWVRKRSAEALWHLTRRCPERWVSLLAQKDPSIQNLLRQVELG